MIDLIPHVAPLADQFNRPITYLRVSVTDRCNLRCVYCMPEAGLPWIARADTLSFEEIASIVRAAASIGVRSIRLTGGEPLVRRDLARLVARIARSQASTTSRSRPTVCCWPSKSKGCAPPACGGSISRSTRCARTAFSPSRAGTGLERVLAGIDAALGAGLGPIKLNCVVMRGQNDDEVVAFAELTRERRIYVRFIEMMPVLENVALQRDAYISAAEILDRIRASASARPGSRPGRERAGALFCVSGRGRARSA